MSTEAWDEIVANVNHFRNLKQRHTKMKKTFNINVAGFPFIINDDAYISS